MISEEEENPGVSAVSNIDALDALLNPGVSAVSNIDALDALLNGMHMEDILSAAETLSHQEDKSQPAQGPTAFSSLPDVDFRNFSSNEDFILDCISSSEAKVARSIELEQRVGSTVSWSIGLEQWVGSTVSEQQQNNTVLCCPLKVASTTAQSAGGNDHMEKYVIEPTENDVLLGRGGRSNHHKGNEAYRKLIQDHKRWYKDCPTKPEKTKLSQYLVTRIHEEHNGRFLLLDQVTGKWCIVPDSIARRKVSQALRENSTPEFRAAKRRKYSKKSKLF